jgi:hypothetical protein
MTLRRVRIGAVENAVQYDDADYDSAFETDKPIKAGTPVDLNDVVRLGDIAASIIAVIYHVGCIYISVDATNPFTRFGFGTWVAFGAGKVLVGLDAMDTDFDTSEETGGAKTKAIGAHAGADVDDHASHDHDVTSNVVVSDHPAIGTNVEGQPPVAIGTGTDDAAPAGHNHQVPAQAHAVTNNLVTSAGPSATLDHTVTQPNNHADLNVVQPYVVVYMWKRTA